MKEKTHLIINPSSAAGKTGQRQSHILAALHRHLGQPNSLCLTSRPGEATTSAREAILAGSDLVIAVGGDGTIQETVNGFFSQGKLLRPGCQLGIINSGTGGGFVQSLGLPPDIESQCRVIGEGRTRLIDVGRAVFSDGKGAGLERLFINECQAGIGGEVVKKVRGGYKKLGGLLGFGLSTLAVALNYPNRKMTISVDDGPEVSGRFIGIVAANGNTMAGGMRLAPRAQVEDGLLDILFIHGQTLPERLWNFPKIYSGSHLTSPKFSYFQGKSIRLTSEEEVTFEADGELCGHLPCRIDILPSALRVRANPRREG
jgi:diacylglycerol kinase (ATP)